MRACFAFLVENTGSNTSKKTKNRRLATQPCMQALADYRTTFTHCAISTEFEGLPFVDDDDDDPTIRKKTDCFSNGHQSPTVPAGKKIFFSRTGRKRNGRASLSISRTNTPSYRMLQLLVPCGLAISFGRFVRLSCTFSTDFRSDVCAVGGGKTRITSENKKESC